MTSRFLFIIIILGMPLILGCFGDKTATPAERPKDQPSTVVQNIITLQGEYRQNKLQYVITETQKLIAKEPSNWDAVFLLGLAYFKYGDDMKSVSIFQTIPESERSMMTDSCLELQELNTPDRHQKVVEVARSFFPDCLQDLQAKPAQTADEFNRNQIIFYGKLYDAAIRKEDDPGIRQRKEDDFLKKYKLTAAQLEEITTRYLEILAEE